VLGWLGFVVLCNGVGFLSAVLGTDPVLYEHLVRPSWAPPPSLFGPVWTALYILMGTATFLIWRHCRGDDRRRALTIFGVQLALNFAWTPVFFGLQRYGLAIVVIVANAIAVLVMMVAYGRRVRLAGILVVPLLVWVSFATALNIAIWWLNR